MNDDSIFTIGKTHRICQDYAHTGNKNGMFYAILSDGCSSSEHTDLGSRIMVKTAEKYIEEIDSPCY